MSSELATQAVSMAELQKMAEAVAQSGLFGLRDTKQALGLMLLCQAEGLHPAVAARDYHIISGKPALKADAMLARFQAAGGKIEFSVYTDREVKARFSHPSGGSLEVSWTIEQAKAANLTGKDTWRQYPRQMLRSRVISEGIRAVYPVVLVGVYTPEEVGDFDVKPAPVAEIVEEVKPAISPAKQAPAKQAAALMSDMGLDKSTMAALCGAIVRRTIGSASEVQPSEWPEIVNQLETIRNAVGTYGLEHETISDVIAAFIARFLGDDSLNEMPCDEAFMTYLEGAE